MINGIRIWTISNTEILTKNEKRFVTENLLSLKGVTKNHYNYTIISELNEYLYFTTSWKYILTNTPELKWHNRQYVCDKESQGDTLTCFPSHWVSVFGWTYYSQVHEQVGRHGHEDFLGTTHLSTISTNPFLIGLF